MTSRDFANHREAIQAVRCGLTVIHPLSGGKLHWNSSGSQQPDFCGVIEILLARVTRYTAE
jgi:hypothetical protein